MGVRASLFNMRGLVAFLAVFCACVAVSHARCNKDILQEHCLDKLKPKWSLDNVKILGCFQAKDEEGTKHFFKYIRLGPRDHCTCSVMVTSEGIEQFHDAFCV